MNLNIILIIVSLYLGYKIGYIHAHHIVSRECNKLGGFYYGKKIYKCELANPNKENR